MFLEWLGSWAFDHGEGSGLDLCVENMYNKSQYTLSAWNEIRILSLSFRLSRDLKGDAPLSSECEGAVIVKRR